MACFQQKSLGGRRENLKAAFFCDMQKAARYWVPSSILGFFLLEKGISHYSTLHRSRTVYFQSILVISDPQIYLSTSHLVLEVHFEKYYFHTWWRTMYSSKQRWVWSRIMECIVLLPTLSLHFLLQCISTEAGERDSKTLYDLHHHHGRRGLIRQSIVTCLCP